MLSGEAGLFPSLEPLGFHIVGDHFYELIPNLRELGRNYQETLPRPLPDVTTDLEKVERDHTHRLSEYGYEFRKQAKRFGYKEINLFFQIDDAISLYCFLHEKKPSRVVEVGKGFSTSVILSALAKNRSETSDEAVLASIDPYDRLSTTHSLE